MPVESDVRIEVSSQCYTIRILNNGIVFLGIDGKEWSAFRPTNTPTQDGDFDTLARHLALGHCDFDRELLAQSSFRAVVVRLLKEAYSTLNET